MASLWAITVWLSLILAPMALQCDIEPAVECGYFGIQREECVDVRNCCWRPSSANVPWCFKPQCAGYTLTKLYETEFGFVGQLQLKKECTLYGRDVLQLNLHVERVSSQIVQVKIFRDGDYEVPVSLFQRPQSIQHADADYQVDVSHDPFSIKVTRILDGYVIFDTSASQLLYEVDFLKLSTKVPPNANIYGLGEAVHAYRRDPYYTRQTMWARDAATPADQNLYGSHPFYMEMRNGSAHGVLLLNSNGMDVILKEGIVTYKVLGGVLDFYVFTGSTPADVVRQYVLVIGKPAMPPYYALGFQQSRWGYKSVDHLQEVVEEYRAHELPLETVFSDIDYMEGYKDFALDQINFPADAMRNFTESLHASHQRYVIIVDPAIKVEAGYAPYQQLIEQNLTILRADTGKPFVGRVWPGDCVFPDFLNPRTQQWWTLNLREFMTQVDADGLWIDMNEPASFCHTVDGPCDDPLVSEFGYVANDNQLVLEDVKQGKGYRINNGGNELPLTFKTVAPDALHWNGTRHGDVHNLYGHSEAIMTRNALLDIQPGKRPFVLTRSTFVGTGQHAAHWLGDNHATWESMRESISGMLSFQLFGLPLVGADICGFAGDTTEELCTRWIELGAFYPLARSHNALNALSQELYRWSVVERAAKAALRVRYQLLPLYYTLFYQAHTFGDTVVRPLLFEYPHDAATLMLDRQFLIGSGVMVSPCLLEGARTVDAYFPAGKWYDWYTHAVVYESDNGEWHTVDAPLEYVNVHIRGGTVLVTQEPALTTYQTRLSDFRILVALDIDGAAIGQLYLDDGESLDVGQEQLYVQFDVEHERLIVSGAFGYKSASLISQVEVLGIIGEVCEVQLNGARVTEWSQSSTGLLVKLTDLQLQEFHLQWSQC